MHQKIKIHVIIYARYEDVDVNLSFFSRPKPAQYPTKDANTTKVVNSDAAIPTENTVIEDKSFSIMFEYPVPVNTDMVVITIYHHT
jgi:predicted transcriptional regulator